MESSPEFIGRTVGNYRILGELGSGGMGTVYVAEDIRLKRHVALKLLSDPTRFDKNLIERFQREALVASSLNHPHICTVYDAGEDNGIAYLAMELLEGQTLEQKIGSGRLSTETVLQIGVQICDALACAHDKDIVHRDLKPSNVFITRRGDAKLLDFGLAKRHRPGSELSATASASITQVGQLLGTVPYMSPEQARGESLDARSDIFSLGAVLYEMGTGKRAFPGASTAAIFSDILHGEPVPPRSLNPALPEELQRIIDKALEKDRADRYQSATEMMIDLRRLTKQVSGAVRSRPDTQPNPSPLSHPRGRTFRYAGVAAAVVAAIVAAILLTPAPVSGPLESTQITSDAEFKQSPLFTDGSRLYFGNHGKGSEMAVSGGAIEPMQIIQPGMGLFDISADGSKALVKITDLNDNVGRGTLWEAPLLGGTLRKLSDHFAQRARWSPDGRTVYFADEKTLFVMDADGTNIRKIWDAPFFVSDLSVSPDARKLSVTIDSLHSRLWEVGTDGSNPHPLNMDWPGDADQSEGLWSPDEKHFIFSSDREGRSNVYELVKPRWFEFWHRPAAVRLTGNELDIQGFVPARDSRDLFVLGLLKQGTAQVYDPRVKKFVPFLDGFPALDFVISPDRQWMAYTEYPTGFLWKSRLDGSEKVQLTSSPAYMLSWSPDNKSLVYSDWIKLYVVSADGGAPEKLLQSGDQEVAPSWAPDGKSIEFNYYPYPDRPLPGIQMLDLATRKLSVMPGSEGFYVPSWSRDGKYLAAVAREPARMMLYSTETKTWKELIRLKLPFGYWTWAQDNKSLYMAETQGENGIYRLTVPEGAWEKVSSLDGVNNPSRRNAFVSLTADGQPAMMSHTGVTQIYSLHWKR